MSHFKLAVYDSYQLLFWKKMRQHLKTQFSTICAIHPLPRKQSQNVFTAVSKLITKRQFSKTYFYLDYCLDISLFCLKNIINFYLNYFQDCPILLKFLGMSRRNACLCFIAPLNSLLFLLPKISLCFPGLELDHCLSHLSRSMPTWPSDTRSQKVTKTNQPFTYYYIPKIQIRTDKSHGIFILSLICTFKCDFGAV